MAAAAVLLQPRELQLQTGRCAQLGASSRKTGGFPHYSLDFCLRQKQTMSGLFCSRMLLIILGGNYMSNAAAFQWAPTEHVTRCLRTNTEGCCICSGIQQVQRSFCRGLSKEPLTHKETEYTLTHKEFRQPTCMND